MDLEKSKPSPIEINKPQIVRKLSRKTILVAFVLAIGLVGGVNLAQQPQEKRSMAAEEVNIALNRPSKASSVYDSSYTSIKAFDGSLSTRWNASAGATTNQWLSVDFGSVKTYGKVIIRENTSQRVTSYTLQWSNDDVTYTDIPGTAGTTIGIFKTITFTPVTSRYVRLFMNSSSPSEPTIDEILVYQYVTPTITITNTQAPTQDDTEYIQSLLNNPKNGVVDIPYRSSSNPFIIRPELTIPQGVIINGNNTTLKVKDNYGDYRAILTASTSTDVSGLKINNVIFDQNAGGNPINTVNNGYLPTNSSRFVLLLFIGKGITITNNQFINTNNTNTVVTGSGTYDTTISYNYFSTINKPQHDHSSIYTSGTGTVIDNNTFIGNDSLAAAIEVHGKNVLIQNNIIKNYYRGANIVASDTIFTKNTIYKSANCVDLWSVDSPDLRNVTITENLFQLDLAHWTQVMQALGRVMPAKEFTQTIIYEASSKYPFVNIIINNNKSIPLETATPTTIPTATPTMIPSATPTIAPTVKPTASPVDITWTSRINTVVSGSTIKKTSTTTGWNAGARSSQTLTSGNGYAQTTINDNTTQYRMFGLNHNNSTASYTDIDYAFYFRNGSILHIYENGTRINFQSTYKLGDVFKIILSGGKVRYYKNSSVIYTSLQKPVYPLFIDVSFYNINSQFTNARLVRTP